MEIFMTLTKYNIRQRREEGCHYSWRYLANSPPHNSVQRIYEEWDILINVHR